MPMPDGCSMMWMRAPGQSWLGAASAFLIMWTVMMAAMMLPSLALLLRRYRESLGENAAWIGVRLALVSVGYLAVWGALGLAIYPLGVAFDALAMQDATVSQAIPVASGVVLLLAGAWQFTAWKARHLTCCRTAATSERAGKGRLVSAWRDGLRLGVHCVCACAGPTAALLALGMMDLRVMAIVTLAITAERLIARAIAVRAIGVTGMAAGVWLIAQALGGG